MDASQRGGAMATGPLEENFSGLQGTEADLGSEATVCVLVWWGVSARRKKKGLRAVLLNHTVPGNAKCGF